MLHIRCLFVIFLCVLTACQSSSIQQTSPTMPSNPIHSNQHSEYEPNLSIEAEQIVMRIRGVDDSVAVIIEKDVSVAIQVDGFDRFRLKKIRKEAQRILEKKMEGSYTFHITTDKKLFKEFQKLQIQFSNQQSPPEPLLKKYKKLNDDMQS